MTGFVFRNVSEANMFENSTASGTASEMTQNEKKILIAFYSTVLLVALTGNIVIILVFFKYKPLRKSINYFVVAMAISDILTPLTIMPFKIAEKLSRESFLLHVPLVLGTFLCKLCYFLADASQIVSIESLILISVDRLIAVVFPLKKKLITKKIRVVCILISWIIAISVNVPYLFIYQDSTKRYCMKDWGILTSQRYVTAMFITFFLIPACLLTVRYSIIGCTLTRRRTERKRMSKSKRSQDPGNNRRIITLSVATLATFLVCIGPLFVKLVFCMFLERPIVAMNHPVS